MSHNVTLKDVKFTDMTMLGSIVSELSQGKCTLDMEAKKFRTYAGQPTHCDGKITLPGRHDIGLLKNEDGAYNPVFDPYQMDQMFKSPHGTSYIGRIAQEYALQTAEYEAAQNGMSSERVQGEKGTVLLELTQN